MYVTHVTGTFVTSEIKGTEMLGTPAETLENSGTLVGTQEPTHEIGVETEGEISGIHEIQER